MGGPPTIENPTVFTPGYSVNLLSKFVRLVLVIICVTLFAFSLVSLLPGDAARTFNPFASPEQIAQIRADLRVDDPFPVRYGRWLGDFVRGDLGQYYGVAGDTVADKFGKDFPKTLLLVLYTQIFVLLLAIPLGVFTGARAGSAFDKSMNLLFFLALSIPAFVLAFFFKKYLTIDREVLPERGWVDFSVNPVEHFRHLILPVLCLGLSQIAVYARLLRSDMVATLQEDYITMAKAKGIKPNRILFRHALRPSSLTLLTVIGLNVGTLIGGAVIIERIFGLPGIGTDTVEALQARQIVAVQSFVAVIGIAFVLVNFVVDLLYSVLDPRIRRG